MHLGYMCIKSKKRACCLHWTLAAYSGTVLPGLRMAIGTVSGICMSRNVPWSHVETVAVL